MREELSRAEIQSRACTILKKVYGRDYQLGRRADVKSLVHTFVKNEWLKFDDGVDLKKADPRGRALGCFMIKPNTIWLDKSLKSHPRYEFTLAHEIGHFCLHRPYMKDLARKRRRPLPKDTEDTIDSDEPVNYRFSRRTELEWVEWQANQFAMMLLYPKQELFSKISEVQEALGVIRCRGGVYLDDNLYSMADASQVLSCLTAEHFVSRSLMWNHLKYTGLLVDVRKKSRPTKARDIMSSSLFELR